MKTRPMRKMRSVLRQLLDGRRGRVLRGGIAVVTEAESVGVDADVADAVVGREALVVLGRVGVLVDPLGHLDSHAARRRLQICPSSAIC